MTGREIFIVGGGPSLQNFNFDRFVNKETIAVNKSTRKSKTYEEIYGIEKARMIKEMISKTLVGRKQTEESNEKRRKTLTGKKKPEGFGEKQRKAKIGKKLPKGTGEKIGKAHIGITKEINPNLIRSEESKERSRKSNVGKKRSKRTVDKIKKKWQNPEFKEKQLAAMFGGFEFRITKPEKQLNAILQKLLPKEYKYVGEGQIFIAGKVPDFININGQKKIIELFGDYWHSEEKTGRTKEEEENQRIKHFSKYGWRTIIVWQCELQDMKQLEEKLLLFHER